jgi:hypothetical protein
LDNSTFAPHIGIAPDGFSSISGMYWHWWAENPDHTLNVLMSYSISGDGESNRATSVADVAVTSCNFQAVNQTMYKKSLFNLTAGADFEDTVAPGDVFGISIKQTTGSDMIAVGISIIWEF